MRTATQRSTLVKIYFIAAYVVLAEELLRAALS